ncbi:MAG: hypothetical protein QM710_12745 [Flavobacterium sp.]
MPTIKMSLVDVWGNENSLTAENAWTLTRKDGKWKLFRDRYNSNMPAK